VCCVITALVWQLMKAYTLSILTRLAGTGHPIVDKEIVEWANDKVSCLGILIVNENDRFVHHLCFNGHKPWLTGCHVSPLVLEEKNSWYRCLSCPLINSVKPLKETRRTDPNQ